MRAAAAQSGERGSVIFVEIRMRDNFARHDRYTANAGNFFPLDQLQRLAGIPFIHVNDFAAGERGRLHDAIISRHMKQRRGDQCYRDRCIGGVNRLGAIGPRQSGRGTQIHKNNIHNVQHTAAMGQLRTFGAPGGAGSVKNTGIIIRIHSHVRHISAMRAQIGIINHTFHRRGQTYTDNFHIGILVAHGQKCVQPILIADQNFRRRIFQAIGHFIRNPPGIHAHHANTD